MLDPQAKPRSLLEIFEELKDPRKPRNQLHSLIDIVAIAICSILCGANNWEQVERFGNDKVAWFKTFLELQNGIPSHDTFNDFFRFLDPEDFQEKFIEWTKWIADILPGEVIAIDGKTARRSHDIKGNTKAIHCVSAFAATNRITLGQVKTEEKSNEITAIPLLLKTLQISGCIVTIDAMGCQKDIAKQIVSQGADYILALKGNHEVLHDEMENFFQQAEAVNFKGVPGVKQESEEKNRGRTERRFLWVTSGLEWLDQRGEWANLKSLIMVKSERTSKGVTSVERRYYLSSLAEDTPQLLSKVRDHWSIENSLHWILDVVYEEDRCRLRKDYGAQNFSLLRKLTLNLLKQDKKRKGGIETKRLSAGWDDGYREQILKGK